MAKTKKINSIVTYGAKDKASPVVTAYTKRIEKQLDKMGKNFTKNSRKIRKDTSAISKSMAGLSKSFVNMGQSLLAGFSLVALTRFAKASVQAFEEQEKAVVRLQMALQNAGLDSGKYTKEIMQFAGEMQKLVGIGDEKIAPIIQRFIELGLSVNFAGALAGRVTFLKKYGIEVENSKDKGKMLNDVLDQMNKKFAGQASILIGTGTEGLNQAMLSLGDAMEGLGGAVVSSNYFKVFAIALEDVSTWMNKTAGATDKYITSTQPLEERLLVIASRMQEIAGSSFMDKWIKGGNQEFKVLDTLYEKLKRLNKEREKASQRAEIDRMKAANQAFKRGKVEGRGLDLMGWDVGGDSIFDSISGESFTESENPMNGDQKYEIG